MKKLMVRLSVFVLLVSIGQPAEAVVVVKPEAKQEVAAAGDVTPVDDVATKTMTAKELKKQERKQKKLEKRLKKLEKRLEKKQRKGSKKYFGGATDNNKFRLGLLCLLGGIGFVLLVNIIGLGWLLGGLGGLVALIGVCLMIWGLLEYTN